MGVVYVLKQVLRENDQVLDIDYAVTPGHRANIVQWLVRTPIINHYAHIGRVDNSVAVKVNDGDDWRLPYVIATEPAGPPGSKV